MTKDEMKNKISMALKDPILQQGFEIICKNLAELEEENKQLKQQIEKIKNCENCKNADINKCLFCSRFDYIKKQDFWEGAE